MILETIAIIFVCFGLCFIFGFAAFTMGDVSDQNKD
jgi:hypothetical protein